MEKEKNCQEKYLGVIVIVHEAWDCIADLCYNIYSYCGKDTRIYLHTNQGLWKNEKRHIMETLPSDCMVYIYPKPWTKKLFSCDLLKAYIEVIEYANQGQCLIENWLLLTSNCLFVEPFHSWKPTIKVNHLLFKGWNWWKNIFHPHNRRIHNHFQKMGIPYIGHYHHEGTVLSNDTFLKIIQHIRQYPFLLQDKPVHFPGEEFILPSLEVFFTGSLSRRCCKFFNHKKNKVFMPEYLQELEGEICVKRVPRLFHDPVRAWIRNRMFQSFTNTSSSQKDSHLDLDTDSAPQNTPPIPSSSQKETLFENQVATVR